MSVFFCRADKVQYHWVRYDATVNGRRLYSKWRIDFVSISKIYFVQTIYFLLINIDRESDSVSFVAIRSRWQWIESLPVASRLGESGRSDRTVPIIANIKTLRKKKFAKNQRVTGERWRSCRDGFVSRGQQFWIRGRGGDFDPRKRRFFPPDRRNVANTIYSTLALVKTSEYCWKAAASDPCRARGKLWILFGRRWSSEPKIRAAATTAATATTTGVVR